MILYIFCFLITNKKSLQPILQPFQTFQNACILGFFASFIFELKCPFIAWNSYLWLLFLIDVVVFERYPDLSEISEYQIALHKLFFQNSVPHQFSRS